MIRTEERLTTDLVDKGRNNLHPEAPRLLRIKPFRKAGTIVRDRKLVTFAMRAQHDRNLALGMFGGVRHKFADNISQRYSDRGRDFQHNAFNHQAAFSTFGCQNVLHVVAKILKKLLEFDAADVIQSVKTLVNAADRGDTIGCDS